MGDRYSMWNLVRSSAATGRVDTRESRQVIEGPFLTRSERPRDVDPSITHTSSRDQATKTNGSNAAGDDVREVDGTAALNGERSDPLPRIAFFTPALTYGGAQRVTVNVANSLAECGHTVDLVAGRLEGEFIDDISDAVTTVDLDVPQVPGIGILASVPYLVSYLESSRPAVLFSSRMHTNIAAVVAGRLANVDVHVAATQHSPYDWQSKPKDSLARAIATRVYPLADDVVAVSEGVAESVIANTRLGRDGTTVLNNSIDVAAIRMEADEAVDHEWFTDPEIDPIVSLGRLEPVKDYPTLLKAFAILTESRPQTRLVIMGKGSERRRLISLARSLGIDDRTRIPGYVDNPFAYMRRASVFVHSSKSDGLPTVLIEALACSCSIVSTDCQYGPREILNDGRYGVLIPVGDPARMADAIARALGDPSLSDECHERVEQFSLEAGADRYERYVRRVVEND